MAVLVSYFIPVVNIILLKEWYENVSIIRRLNENYFDMVSLCNKMG